MSDYSDQGRPNKVKILIELEVTQLVDQIMHPGGGYDEIHSRLQGKPDNYIARKATIHDLEEADFNTFADFLDNSVKITVRKVDDEPVRIEIQ